MSRRSRVAAQPRVAAMSSVAAVDAGGSPARRPTVSASTSDPTTSLTMSMTSRTDEPTPRPTFSARALGLDSQWAAAATWASARSATWM